jgi:hypothetical protein
MHPALTKKAASRIVRKGADGRFDFCVTMNRRDREQTGRRLK